MSDLRDVMRQFPHGVVVLTVDAEGERLGLTVASLVSLSLEPPLVGVAVSRQAAMHELLRRAGGFALSLLAEGQDRLAQHFARGVPPIALWERIPLREGIEGPPQLAEAAGWLRCRVSHELETGDHTFFVASVEAADPGRAGTRPLVLHDQAYTPL